MKYKLIILLVCFVSLYQGQTENWGGVSVSTSDDLDALSLNPAGLAIRRGNQDGMSMQFPVDKQDLVYLYSSSRRGPIGYTLSSSSKDIFSLDYSLGVGFNLGTTKVMAGIQYISNHNLRIGLLGRPLNFFSVGAVAEMSVEESNNDKIHLKNIRLGSALRPIGSRFTLGADVISPKDDFKNLSTQIFAQARPISGLNVKVGYLIPPGKGDPLLQFNLSFTLGKIGGSLSHTKHSSSIFVENVSQNRHSLRVWKPNIKSRYVKYKMNGFFIEEPVGQTGFNFGQFLPPILGGISDVKRVQLRTWINAVDEMIKDDNLDGMIIELDYAGGGFAAISQAREALMRFKNSGKNLIVHATAISNIEYYFISMADEIYMPDLSILDLRGLSIEVRFFKDLMDTLGIVAEVEQISPYKTASDPFIRSEMSDEMRENFSMLFGDIYKQFVQGIADGRSWTLERTKEIINNGPYSTRKAIDADLINKSIYPDEYQEYIKEIDGKEVEFVDISFYDKSDEYIYEWVPKESKIAVIYAVGGIELGKSVKQGGESTVMGNETISKAIKKAREDDSVDAIVLRIDSGGGSALASDLMWKEVWNSTVHDTNHVKPFIASMSSVAASGGYYIACQADTILAHPSTITGSIGVIGGRINFSRLWEKLYTHVDRIKFGDRSDAMSGSRLWTQEERELVREEIVSIYGNFLNRVAEGRENLDSLDVHDVGIGKVWSGKRALEIGLVDKLGDLNDSIELAKKTAGKGEDYKTIVVEYPQLETLSLSTFLNLYHGGFLKQLPKNGLIGDLKDILMAIPNFENDQSQMILPYQIIIK